MKNEKKHVGSILKRETKVIAYVVICLVVIVIGSSYALFFQVTKNENNQVVKSGTLRFTYADGTQITRASNEACFEAMSFEKAQTMSACEYQLSVQNTGTLPSTYQLKLSTNANNTLEPSKMKVILKKQVGDSFSIVGGYPIGISELTNEVLASENLDASETVVYSVQVFIDGSTITEDDDGKVVSLNINGIGEVYEPTSTPEATSDPVVEDAP